jgi:glycosyltransferase involved in cell wall biosynthesis
MIVRDEQDRATRCINSIKAVADELCVIDTGSVDETPELLRREGANVVRDTSCNGPDGLIADFSHARNACLDLAKHEWILSIDADEVLHNTSVGAVQRILFEQRGDCVAVEMRSSRSTWLAHRLFKRIAQHRFIGIVHETIGQPRNVITNRDLMITNHPDKKGKETAIARDIRLCRRGMEIDPAEGRYVVYYARALKNAGQYEEAAHAFKAALRFHWRSAVTRHSLLTGLAVCELLLERWQEALVTAKQALQCHNRIAETFCVAGDALLALGNVAEAEAMYLTALSLPFPPAEYHSFVDASFFRSYPQQQLAYCHILTYGDAA